MSAAVRATRRTHRRHRRGPTAAAASAATQEAARGDRRGARETADTLRENMELLDRKTTRRRSGKLRTRRSSSAGRRWRQR